MLYPELDPYETGFLSVSHGNRLYWEECGNPAGKPVVVLHGGPGSGCSTSQRRFFDPAHYRIVLFDQRNCGRSLPHASDFSVDLTHNTTSNLISDIETLRIHLEIDRWMVFGSSWGVTLGLVYAQTHPERVTEMVCVAVTTTRRSEIDWLYRGVSPLFPAQFAEFVAGVPEEARAGDLVSAYYTLLQSDDAATRREAALAWNRWENSLVSIDQKAKPSARRQTNAFQICFARLVTHYFAHGAWLEDDQLLRNAHRLAEIPAVLINGRLDFAGPLTTAWELHQAWPGSELIIVQGAGHSSGDPGMTETIIEVTDRFKNY